MKINGIQHFNIRCTPEDIPSVEKFYDEYVGLKKGPRPTILANGAWLYLDDRPILHITARLSGRNLRENHNCSVDHIAFDSNGAVEFRYKLDANKIEYDESNIAGTGYQIFLYDPVNTLLEFNFPNNEAPDDVPLGTSWIRK